MLPRSAAQVCLLESRTLLTAYIMASPDELSLGVGGTGSVNVLANDMWGDDDPNNPQSFTPTAAIGSGPSHGSVTDLGGGIFEYTADPLWAGTDSFTYIATGGGAVAEGTVFITVEAMTLQAMTDADYSTIHDQTLVSLDSVLANDMQGSAPVQIVSYTQPQHGTVDMNMSTGRFTYTPEADYVGGDWFE